MQDPMAELQRRNLSIDYAAVDLIFRMIHPDPSERLNLDQVKEHLWTISDIQQ
jgi:hypothetical protein